MAGEISHVSHNYSKDLKHVSYGCHGLPYGKEDQTILKQTHNCKWSGLFLKSFRGKMLSKARCNGWTLHLVCGPWLD